MMRATAGLIALALVIGGAPAADLPETPTAGRPAVKVPFPAIKDWSSLRIQLSRSPCYGWCPSYSVVIAGDGTVSWFGERYVEAKGARTSQVPEEKVRALYGAFVKADFFWTFDNYEAPITDLPTQVLIISFDGHTKKVLDYAGGHVGMPKAIDDLEDEVDAVADTKAWVGHTREP